MKLLLTGPPGVGKTTLLLKLIPVLSNPIWIVSEEIKDNGRRRVGFSAKTSRGQTGVFAHKSEIDSSVRLGDYKVDIAAVDNLFTDSIKSAPSDNFIVIDEIGRMQMLSPKFHHAAQELFGKDVNVLATIRYGDEWTKEFTKRSDTITFTLTADNQDVVRENIGFALAAVRATDNLPLKQKAEVYKMAREYLANDHQTQIRKLFKNAIFYFAEGKVRQAPDGTYEVDGHHGTHKVTRDNDGWTCDCDLFSSRGAYVGEAGECSHVQAAKLSNITA